MRKKWIAILAVCAASGAAMAAEQPDAGRPGRDRAAMEQRHAQREAKRADDMALLIGLRPDQRPAFDRFLQSMHPPHDGPHGMRDAATRKPVEKDAPLPARLDAMEAAIDRHDTQAKQRIAEARTFYASLTPDQQHRFDALDDLRDDRMHGRREGFRRAGDFAGGPPPALPTGG